MTFATSITQKMTAPEPTPLSPIIRMLAERIVAEYLAELAEKEKRGENATNQRGGDERKPEGRDLRTV